MNINIMQTLNSQEYDTKGALENLFQLCKKDNFANTPNLEGSLRVNWLYRDTYDYFFNQELFPNLHIQCGDIVVRFEDPMLAHYLKSWFNLKAQYFPDWIPGQEITETFAKKVKYLECELKGPLTHSGYDPYTITSYKGMENFINVVSVGQDLSITNRPTTNYALGLYQSQAVTKLYVLPNLTRINYREYSSLPNITEMIFPATVTNMSTSACGEMPNLHTIMVGPNVTTIDLAGQGYMWHGLFGLQTVVWMSPEPQPFTSPGYGTQITSVYVPDASVDAYKNTGGWSILSGSIKPVSTAPADLKQKIFDNYNITV